jgi:hypothetical protein
MEEQDYIKDLEKIAKVITQPFKNLPFPSVIRLLSGCKVLNFDYNNPEYTLLLSKLKSAAELAGKEAFKVGIFTKRPNEAGNKIEPFVKEALRQTGLIADTPVAKNGKRKSTGYPDIQITYGNNLTAYLECKTYNIKNINTSQKAFYFSPSENFKVTKDALHLMLSYQLVQETRDNKPAYVPIHWKILTLDSLTVDLKHEFNQSNVKMYGRKSEPNSVLAEGKV